GTGREGQGGIADVRDRNRLRTVAAHGADVGAGETERWRSGDTQLIDDLGCKIRGVEVAIAIHRNSIRIGRDAESEWHRERRAEGRSIPWHLDDRRGAVIGNIDIS